MNLKFVFDASPLIHLGKAGLAKFIVALKGEKYTVPAVFEEVVRRGKEMNYPDYSVTESLVREGEIEVKALRKDIVDGIAKLHSDIHWGESQVIALSKELKAIAVLDDRVARAVARIQGVRVEGSYGLVLRAAASGSVSEEEGQRALRALVSSGWRCDAKLYAYLLNLLSGMSRADRALS